MMVGCKRNYKILNQRVENIYKNIQGEGGVLMGHQLRKKPTDERVMR